MRKIILLWISLGLVMIVSAQNIGVGTTSPTEKLHVAGNIRSDTIKPTAFKLSPNAGSGKIMVSDAVGNATWQTSSLAAAGNIGYGVWGDCATNGNISEYQPVTDVFGASGDGCGYAVAMTGNFSFVGSPGDNSAQGSVNIYAFDGTQWVFQQKITDATGSAGDEFGSSIAVSGNYLIVGARNDDIGANTAQGSVSIFNFNGTSWVLMQKISSATGASGDNFGYSVSISGTKAIIGIPNDDIGANTDQGSASVYNYNGSSWVLQQSLTDAAGAVGDNLGRSVSISGSAAAAGASYDDVSFGNQGSVSTFQYTSSWIATTKITGPASSTNALNGTSVSISGNYLVIGASGANSNLGIVGIYKNTGVVTNIWTLAKTINEGNALGGSNLGFSVFMSENYMIAGAPTNNGVDGAVVIYQLIGSSWMKLQRVVDPAAETNEDFGYNTAIDGTSKRFLIGANQYGNIQGKVIFGKIN